VSQVVFTGPTAFVAAISHVFPIARPFASPLKGTTATGARLRIMSVLVLWNASHANSVKAFAAVLSGNLTACET
jgi:hypothetical protein